MKTTFRARVAVVLTTVATLAVPAFLASPADAQATSCTVTPEDWANDAEEQKFLALLNEYRVQNSLNPLATHPDLVRAAAWLARDMASKNYFSHTDSNGRYINIRFTWCGITYNAWAENIYAHTANFDAQSAFNAWKNSPPHNTNMLLQGITSTGVARAFDASSQYDWYWVNVFTDTAPYYDRPADFDNTKTTDVSVFRPSTGTWFVRNGTSVPFGTNGDIPVPADYDGNGSSDIAVFRPSNGHWFVRNGVTVQFGTSGDVPVPGDYNGNGTTEIAVFRPASGTWFIRNGLTVGFGTSGDIPVPGDYDGNGTTDIAVFRPSSGAWFIRNGLTVGFGTSGDIPVPGDYDGNGTTDIAVFRPSAGVWFIRNGPTYGFGTSGDVPVPGDYDGNGTTDVAVYRPSTGTWFVRSGITANWGTGGDIPLPLPAAIRGAAFP
ncbi:MAG: CAP domain-containing protein [Actinomycetota bacterium]|nr:CAP domain-containing protein [Actinomycetota bacterium]